MKTYNFNKAKQLINENSDKLQSASLGMHEDWFWTAETIWANGEFKREFPDNSDELFEEYKNKREAGMSILSDENKKYRDLILIGGIYGSSWATPVIQLCFMDGSEKMIPCYNGESTEDKNGRAMLGVLSGPVQDQITPISEN